VDKCLILTIELIGVAMNDENNNNSKVAVYLGYCGLAPFVLSLLVVNFTVDFQDTSIRGFILYSAIIISFMSGIHWGMALLRNQGCRIRFMISIVPPILAWAAVLSLPLPFLIGALGLVHLAELKIDRVLFSYPEIQTWYFRMRFRLTSLVVMLHFVMIFSVI